MTKTKPPPSSNSMAAKEGAEAVSVTLPNCDPERKARYRHTRMQRFLNYKKRVAQAERMITNIFGPVGTVDFPCFCEAITPCKRLSIATLEAMIRLIDEGVIRVWSDEDGELLARVMNGGQRVGS